MELSWVNALVALTLVAISAAGIFAEIRMPGPMWTKYGILWWGILGVVFLAFLVGALIGAIL